MDVLTLTIEEALRLLRSKKISSVELIKACLNNIKKFNKKYNVFLTTVTEEALLKEAQAKDQTDHSLPLSGIPIALKDLFITDGLRTTAGSRVLENYIPQYDATVVKRLKNAGAIIIGKVNEDAWGHGASGENSDFGPTGNAYNADFVAGGSSSGSGTAVGLGMCLAATGTDTAGSIRVPAAYNNLVGLKPTYGRVSRYGIIAMASSLDSIGHITKTVKDSAILLSVTAGKDPYDATTGDVPVAKYIESLSRTDLKRLKLGVSHDYLVSGPNETKGMDPDLEARVEDALQKLISLGAEIIDVDLSHTQAGLETYYILQPSEVSSNLSRYDGIRFGNGRETFGSEAKRRITIGTYSLSSGYYDAFYRSAQKVRTLVKRDFDNAFKNVDIIFAPIIPRPPFKIGELSSDPLSLYLLDIYTASINLSGVPSLALPAGFAGNLPVGFQIIGPQWSEEKLFSVADLYQRNTDFLSHRPTV